MIQGSIQRQGVAILSRGGLARQQQQRRAVRVGVRWTENVWNSRTGFSSSTTANNAFRAASNAIPSSFYIRNPIIGSIREISTAASSSTPSVLISSSITISNVTIDDDG